MLKIYEAGKIDLIKKKKKKQIKTIMDDLRNI